MKGRAKVEEEENDNGVQDGRQRERHSYRVKERVRDEEHPKARTIERENDQVRLDSE